MPLWPSIEQTIKPAEVIKGRTMQVKGTSLIATEKFIRHQFGSDGYQRFLGALPPGSKPLFSSTVLSPNWYPIEDAFYRPMQTACDLFYGGKSKGARGHGPFLGPGRFQGRL